MYFYLKLYEFLVKKYKEKGEEPFIKYEEIKKEVGLRDIEDVKLRLQLIAEGDFIRENTIYFVKISLLPFLAFKKDGIEYYLAKKRDIPNTLSFLKRFLHDSEDSYLHEILRIMPD